MDVDYRAVFRVKTAPGTEPPSLDDVRAMLTLALMRSEVWLIQSLAEGDLEIQLSEVRIHDWAS